MESQREASRPMFVGGAIFIGIGLLMVVRGILHIISGEPIDSIWTEATTGPESLFVGIAGIGIGLFAIRLGRRGDPK